jgi:lysophospholipase L1-like esterase
MNLFKSSIIDKMKNQKDKTPIDLNRKEKNDDKKIAIPKQLIEYSSGNKNFNTPNEALGEIFNLMVKIEKQKQFQHLTNIDAEKQRQSVVERRNKELIQSLTGRLPKKIEQKPVKEIPFKPSFLGAALPAVAIAAGVTLTTSAMARETPQVKPSETKPIIGAEEQVFTGPMTGIQEQVFTGPMNAIQENVFTGPMTAVQEQVFTGPMEPIKDKSEEEKERNLQELRERARLESERKIREQQELKRKQDEEERIRQENKLRQEQAIKDAQKREENIANRRDEEAYANQTLQRISTPQPIIPNTGRVNQGEQISTNQQPAPEPPVQIVGGVALRQIYAIGDSHADRGGLSSHEKIINRANGGQASTSSKNYGGKHTIRKSDDVGLDNVPPNQIVLISQGANDTANAMKNYLDRMQKFKKGEIKTEPKLPPASIIAQNVAKLVSAAKERGHIPVFLLFPNGPGRGRLPGHPPIAEYYGGDYQEEVRRAIRSAVEGLGVPIVDAQGLDLYDGIHARNYASVAKKMVEIAREKERKLNNRTQKISSIDSGMENFNNLFNMSNQNMNMFSSLEDMLRDTADIDTKDVQRGGTFGQSNVPLPESSGYVAQFVSDKPSLTAKTFEMKELIIG